MPERVKRHPVLLAVVICFIILVSYVLLTWQLFTNRMGGIENALYYTFSTVSQTLAGAITLLGAFVLYRFQLLDRDINESVDDIRTHVVGEARKNIEVAIREGHPERILELAKEPSLVVGGVRQELEASRNKIRDTLNLKRSIYCLFMVSLGLTIGLIAASVVVLSVTPLLGQSAWVPFSFRVGLFWFFSCLASYVAILWKSLK
jgi:hypothetical protein